MVLRRKCTISYSYIRKKFIRPIISTSTFRNKERKNKLKAKQVEKGYNNEYRNSELGMVVEKKNKTLISPFEKYKKVYKHMDRIIMKKGNINIIKNEKISLQTYRYFKVKRGTL